MTEQPNVRAVFVRDLPQPDAPRAEHLANGTDLTGDMFTRAEGDVEPFKPYTQRFRVERHLDGTLDVQEVAADPEDQP